MTKAAERMRALLGATLRFATKMPLQHARRRGYIETAPILENAGAR
jgi:hypothetical protein